MTISVKLCGSLQYHQDVFGTSERNAPMYTEIFVYKYELYQTKHTCIV